MKAYIFCSYIAIFMICNYDIGSPNPSRLTHTRWSHFQVQYGSGQGKDLSWHVLSLEDGPWQQAGVKCYSPSSLFFYVELKLPL